MLAVPLRLACLGPGPQRSDGAAVRSAALRYLGGRHVVMIKAANKFWKKWEFRASARNPKRNKVGRMPA